MTAKIIQLRDYQNPRDLAPMHGDIEIPLAGSNHVTAVTAVIGTAATKYSDPNQKSAVVLPESLRGTSAAYYEALTRDKGDPMRWNLAPPILGRRLVPFALENRKSAFNNSNGFEESFDRVGRLEGQLALLGAPTPSILDTYARRYVNCKLIFGNGGDDQ